MTCILESTKFSFLNLTSDMLSCVVQLVDSLFELISLYLQLALLRKCDSYLIFSPHFSHLLQTCWMTEMRKL